MAPWLFSLASVLAVSAVSLVGAVALAFDPATVRRVARSLVAFAVGALLGDAFIHLIPESFSAGPSLRPSLLMLAGVLLFFVVEKLLRHWHHAPTGGGVRSELVWINVLGDGVHNFIDGMLIAASWLVSPRLGLSTTAAVFLHELPQELGDFGVLVNAGLPVRRALWFNLASASLAVAGALVALLAGAALGRAVPDVLVPVAAGGFVYIAGSDLIPELQQDRSLAGLLTQSGFIALGVAVMGALTLVG